MVTQAGVRAMILAALNMRRPDVLPRLEAVSARGHPEWGIEGIAGIVNVVLLGADRQLALANPALDAWTTMLVTDDIRTDVEAALGQGL